MKSCKACKGNRNAQQKLAWFQQIDAFRLTYIANLKFHHDCDKEKTYGLVELIDHIQNSCQFHKPLSCSLCKSTEKFSKTGLEVHHNTICPNIILTCDHCNIEMRRHKKDQHVCKGVLQKVYTARQQEILKNQENILTMISAKKRLSMPRPFPIIEESLASSQTYEGYQDFVEDFLKTNRAC